MDATNLLRVQKLYWNLPLRARGAGTRRSESTGELPTYESYKLVDQLAGHGPSEIEFISSGRDPHTSDVFQLIDYATRRRVKTAYVLAPAAVVTRETFIRMRELGLSMIAISLNGASAEIHEHDQLSLGSFDATIAAAIQARSTELPLRIDTSFTRVNLPRFAALAALVGDLEADVWNVSVGYGADVQRRDEQLDPAEVESLFEMLFALSNAVSYRVQTSAAKHYRRFILQHLVADRKRRINTLLDPGAARVPLSLETFCEVDSDERYRHAERQIVKQRSSLSVNPDGTVWAERELPISIGNVRTVPLQRIVSGTFAMRLRNPDELKGKCSACEFRELCGGSRGRAFAATGDPFEGDPLCAYQPRRWREAPAHRIDPTSPEVHAR